MTFTIVGTTALALTSEGVTLRHLGPLLMLIAPALLTYLEIRAIRNPLKINPVAFILTDTKIVFSRQESGTLIRRVRPEQEWDLDATTVKILPATELFPTRYSFKTPGRKEIVVGTFLIDMSPQELFSYFPLAEPEIPTRMSTDLPSWPRYLMQRHDKPKRRTKP